MNQMLGHNAPPDPIDEALAPYSAAISEAENWLDGTPVETEGQLAQVDSLLADIKAAIKAVSAAEESETKPIYDEWKRRKDRYKPTTTDLDRIKRGLLAIAEGFRKRLAAEKAEKARLERIAAEKAIEAARVAIETVDPTDLESVRAVDAAVAEAHRARAKASAASKDTVKGLRRVTRYEIEDHRKALHWIALNDRDALTAFVEDYVRRNFEARAIDGVRTWVDRVAQ